MQAVRHKRLQAQEDLRHAARTHYLWRERGESLQEVRERFRRMVEEGRAGENDDYVIFRWQG
jgi:broad specificity phosphatase PhoE